MIKLLYGIYHWFAQRVPYVVWSRKNKITEKHKKELAALLATDYYVILTGDTGTLSSWIVSFFTWAGTGYWSPYSHALMNCDFITDPDKRDEFKFIEATSVGVHYSTFDEVFSCDYVCLLSPRNVNREEWTKVIDVAVTYNGRPYDDLFDLVDDSRMSCVEVVLNSFKGIEKYEGKFSHLEKLLEEEISIFPQTFKDCSDFIVAYEFHEKRKMK